LSVHGEILLLLLRLFGEYACEKRNRLTLHNENSEEFAFGGQIYVAVKARLWRARLQLRQRLSKYFGVRATHIAEHHFCCQNAPKAEGSGEGCLPLPQQRMTFATITVATTPTNGNHKSENPSSSHTSLLTPESRHETIVSAKGKPRRDLVKSSEAVYAFREAT
jgi:hypothetical protein